MKKINTAIINFNNFSVLSNELDQITDTLTDDSNIFIFTENKFSDTNIINVNIFEVVDFIQNKYKLTLWNIIVYPIKVKEYCFRNNVRYILWFVKDYNKFYFNKDPIREKHIWKDVEWGKRKKNYHPLGKDPGNVWIPTKDDGKGNITEHIIFSINDIIKRCILMSSKENDTILISNCFKSILHIDELELLKRKIIFNNLINNYDLNNLNNNCIKITSRKKETNKSDISLSEENISKVIFKTSEKMQEISNESVKLVVTSPPYWDLKNYFKENQIGQESYDQYINRLEKVWKESYRILQDDGHLFININVRKKNKKPILIPHDIIKSCQKIGFKFKNIIIWHKSSSIPVKNNLTDKFEFFLWFIKSDNFYFNEEAINEINEYKNEYLNKGLFWNINRKAGSVGKNFIHPAIFPLKLIERIIKLTTKENDIVLDPFLGSGTTLIAAIKNNRIGIGYEFNEKFYELIKYRLSTNNININDIQFIYENKNISPLPILRKKD